jgi:thiol-disulfide isomerase/thioredoxin
MRKHLLAFLVGAAGVVACADVQSSGAPGTIVLRSNNDAFSLTYTCSDSTAPAPALAPSALVRGVVLQETSEHILAAPFSPVSAAHVDAVRQAQQNGSIPALEQAVVAYVCSQGSPPTRPPRFPEPGSIASEFVLSPLVGEEQGSPPSVRLSDHQGQPVILIFWSSWCGPCRSGYPELQKLAAHAASKGVALYAVVHQDRPENVRRWQREHGEGVTFLLDSGDRVARDYKVYGIPHTIVIGADRRVRVAGAGYAGAGHDLTKLVDRALAGLNTAGLTHR